MAGPYQVLSHAWVASGAPIWTWKFAHNGCRMEGIPRRNGARTGRGRQVTESGIKIG